MIHILRVTENSMLPDYNEGDFVLIVKIPFFFSLSEGDVIVFRRQPIGTQIKRIQAISPDGKEMTVIGSGPYSVDSRDYGPVYLYEVVGKVLFRITRSGN